MKRVEACFELYHQENEKASCNANSQSEDIDECISLISPEIPDCCLEIILKHGLYLLVPDDWIQDAGCRKLDIECRWLLAIEAFIVCRLIVTMAITNATIAANRKIHHDKDVRYAKSFSQLFMIHQA